MTAPTTRAAPELGGVAEIAAEHNVNRTTISMWDVNNRHGFPKPIVRLSMGPVYDMQEVRRWFKQFNGREQQPSAS